MKTKARAILIEALRDALRRLLVSTLQSGPFDARGGGYRSDPQ
jgi:hypothetical protein